MHADAAAVRQSIRKYMMVGGALMILTVITVAAASLQVGVGLGIVIAVLIATVKASLVAAVFMHLSHEKQWIYGSLILTAAFFAVLMLVPVLTDLDTIGAHTQAPAPTADHSGH